MVGAGSLVYASTLEPKEPFSAPYGIDVAPTGQIYVFDSGNNRVVVFGPDGEQVAEWGGPGHGEGQFDSLGFGALAVDDAGGVFVVDNGNHRVQKFDQNGQFLLAMGDEGDGEGRFRRAIGIAIVGDEVFVTDDEVPFVQVFDRDGNYLRQFGGRGDAPGSLEHATGIDGDADGDVYVSDYERRVVQRFDPTGEPTGVWKSPGPAGTFQIPEGILILENGQVLVTSYRGGEILVLPDEPTVDIEWVIACGDGDEGRLLAPVDLAEGIDGSIYSVDQSAGTVLRYSRG